MRPLPRPCKAHHAAKSRYAKTPNAGVPNSPLAPNTHTNAFPHSMRSLYSSAAQKVMSNRNQPAASGSTSCRHASWSHPHSSCGSRKAAATLTPSCSGGGGGSGGAGEQGERGAGSVRGRFSSGPKEHLRGRVEAGQVHSSLPYRSARPPCAPPLRLLSPHHIAANRPPWPPCHSYHRPRAQNPRPSPAAQTAATQLGRPTWHPHLVQRALP